MNSFPALPTSSQQLVPCCGFERNTSSTKSFDCCSVIGFQRISLSVLFAIHRLMYAPPASYSTRLRNETHYEKVNLRSVSTRPTKPMMRQPALVAPVMDAYG